MIRSIRRAAFESNQTSEFAISRMEDQQLRIVIDRLQKNDEDLKELDLRYVGGLRSYHLEGRTAMFQTLLKALRNNTTITKVNVVLRFLDILSVEEKMELFDVIGSLPSLEHLRVGSSGLSGVALELVSRALYWSRDLKFLNLQSIHFRSSVEHVTRNPSNTADSDFVEFCGVLTTLKKLRSFILEDVEETFDLDALVEHLTTLPVLETLSIKSYKFADSSRLTTQSLGLLSASKTLQSISLKRLHLYQYLPAFVMSLEGNSVLRSLNLEGNQMGRDCGAAFAYLIQFNDTIEELYLGCNLLPDEIGRDIANSLSHNTTLRVLSLHTNFLDLVAATTFAHVLTENKCCLESLDLSQNTIQDEGGTSLALALHSNNNLKTLIVSEAKLTSRSSDFLAAALTINRTLQRLNLADNKIGNLGCFGLAEAIKINTSLKSLNLYGTSAGSAGIMAMSRALESSANLEQLNLSGNEDPDGKCCKALEKMVENNCKLKHLWLPGPASSPTITFYITLNRIGRDQLLQELGNEKLWMKALLESHDDVSALLYFIRANPAVVSFLCAS